MNPQDNKQGSDSVRTMALVILGAVLLGLVFVAGVVTGRGLEAAGIFPRQTLEAAAHDVPSRVPEVSSDGTGGQPAGVVEEQTPSPSHQSSGSEEPDMDVFWEAWEIVEDRFYYDLPSEQERVYGAIRGMLESLGDPYTAFVPPDVARILNEDMSGEFEGIGAYVEEAPEGGVHIIRVFEDGPAERAGIRAGDIIVAVDGQDVTRQVLDQTLLLIRGPAGTEVHLTILRAGEQELLEFTVTRARIEVPTIEARMLEGDIGYVALFDFNAHATDRLEAAIRDLYRQGAKSLILDLRGNPGGFLDQAIGVADLFLPKGVVLIQRDVDGNVQEHTSTNGGIAEDVPLVVLIDGNSASASEIVAGAIQDRQRAILIGETSFGKGSVQILRELSDGSQLRVTYANWYTPNNRSISEQGITPDIVVESQREPGSPDVQLERAVQYLLNGR